jgi:type II secretory pathway component PulF
LKPEWWGSPLVQEEKKKYQEKPVQIKKKITTTTIMPSVMHLSLLIAVSFYRFVVTISD